MTDVEPRRENVETTLPGRVLVCALAPQNNLRAVSADAVDCPWCGKPLSEHEEPPK